MSSDEAFRGADVSRRVGFCDAKGQDAKTVKALKVFLKKN